MLLIEPETFWWRRMFAMAGRSARLQTSRDSLIWPRMRAHAESPRFVRLRLRDFKTVEDKRRMGQIADAVDMESFFILNEAQERGIPGVAIRAVSDAADERLPLDFTQVLDERGRVRISRLGEGYRAIPAANPGIHSAGFRQPAWRESVSHRFSITRSNRLMRALGVNLQRAASNRGAA